MNPYLIPRMETEIERYKRIVDICVYELSRSHHHSEARDAIHSVRQLSAGAALAKLTGSLATLKRQQEA